MYVEYIHLLTAKTGTAPFSFQITRTGLMLIRDVAGKVVASKDLWKIYFAEKYKPGIHTNGDDKDRNVLIKFCFRPCVSNK